MSELHETTQVSEAAGDESPRVSRSVRSRASGDEAAGASTDIGHTRYQAGGLLGSGGMGEVRSHLDLEIGREVAIKVLSEKKSVRGRSAQRFVREAMLQAQLEHPAIVPVYEVGATPEGRPFFSMKRVRGQTLSAVLKDRRRGDPQTLASFTTRRLLEDFSRLCLAVAFIHQRGVIHRDIKPANVMLGEFGEVYLLDWGLAKQRLDHDDVSELEEESAPEHTLEIVPPEPTREGAMLGTPGYMSPEQARRDVAEPITNKADVYALGVLLYEIVTDRRLHRGSSADARIQSTLNTGLVSMAERFPELGLAPELTALIETALNPIPSLRTCDAREMHHRIQRHLDGFRDVESRNRQADQIFDAWRARGLGEGALSERSRAEALESLGKVLALRPEHPHAMAEFVRLLTRPPSQPPTVVAEEMETLESRRIAGAGRLGTFVFLGLNLFGLWVMFQMGPGRQLRVAPFMALTTLTAGLSFFISRLPRPRPVHSFLVFLAAILMVLSLVAVLGPNLVVPAMFATITMAFALNSPVAMGRRIIATGVCASMVTSLAGFLGWTHELAWAAPSPPLAVVSTEAWMPAFVAIANVAVVLLPSLVVLPIRRRIDRAEQHARTTSWQLRHLVPEEIRFFGETGSSDLMRTVDLMTEQGRDRAPSVLENPAAFSGVHQQPSLTVRLDAASEESNSARAP